MVYRRESVDSTMSFRCTLARKAPAQGAIGNCEMNVTAWVFNRVGAAQVREVSDIIGTSTSRRRTLQRQILRKR